MTAGGIEVRMGGEKNVVFSILIGLLVSACSSEPRCDSPVAIKKLISEYKERDLDILVYRNSDKKADFDEKQTKKFGRTQSSLSNKMLDGSPDGNKAFDLYNLWLKEEYVLYNDFEKNRNKAEWNLSKIYTVKKYEITGNVLCEAMISVNLDGWGSSDSELFNYEVKKTPKGKIEIVY
jgi:hypothetical protein